MIITTDFIAEKFNEFNNEYFEGKLVTPRFEITHVKSYLGQYHWVYNRLTDTFNDSVIRISDKFDRCERDICNTIIHEMIHLHIRQNKIKDTRRHHGVVFNSIADRINRQGGWKIARTDSVEGYGLTDKTKINKYYIACFNGARGDYFKFCINEKYLDFYKEKFEKYPNYFRNPFIFVSTDDKKYAHYTKCYKGFRGYFIPENEFKTLRASEKLIYDMQTLGIKHKVA